MRPSHGRCALLVACALVLASVSPRAGAAADPSPPGEKYALLVGVREYDPTELRDLPYAEDDVTALAEVLKKAGYKRVVLMTQTEGAKRARLLPLAANVRKALKAVLEDRAGNDTVLVAFAGHGVQFQDEDESYFCPMDAKLADKSTLVSLSEVYKDLDNSDAGTRLLLADCCRNDPRADQSRAVDKIKLQSVTRPQKALPPGGVAALFSCSAGQKAYESDDLKHGVFFHYVIEGLQGKADLDKDGQVNFEELELYTKRQVPDYVKEKFGDEARQVPERIGKMRGLAALVKLDAGERPPDATTNEPRPVPAGNGLRWFARWDADGYSYPCAVAKIKDGQYFIRYTDGTEEWTPAYYVGKCNIRVGDTVFGNWLNRGLYYQGMVTSRDGDRIHILYDDGDEEDTTIGALRMKLECPDAKEVGCRVFARWSPDGYWYSGTVKDVKDGKYLIKWDDQTETWLDGGDVAGYQPTYGDRVQGDWLGKGSYYPGRVAKRNGEKVRIEYDDGDVEDTTISRLRAAYDGIFHAAK